MGDKILTFDDGNWEQQVLKAPLPVLVDFWAEWCKPCLAMVPDLEALAAQFDGRLRVGKLNVEQNERTQYQYSITSLPTLMLFRGGQVSEQRVGRMSRDKLVKLVEPHLT